MALKTDIVCLKGAVCNFSATYLQICMIMTFSKCCPKYFPIPLADKTTDDWLVSAIESCKQYTTFIDFR